MIRMPASPPYFLDCEIPASGSTSQLEIRVVCEPDDEDPPEPEGYKGTEEIVDLFEAALNAQMWCPTASEYEYARLKVIERSWAPIPPGWRFHCEMTHVAPHSFLPLLAMLTQTHYSYEPLTEVRVTGADTRTLDAEHLLALGIGVRRMPPDLPFSVADERWDGSRGLDIEFEFTDRLTQNRFDEFQAGLTIWDTVRVLGGFQMDFAEAHELPNPGKIVWVGPQTANYSVAEFAEGDAPFVSMFNLLRWQHISGLALNSVTIG
jgi:hypothetical protein